MKQTDKVRILNKQAWVDTITYLCPHRWDGACHTQEHHQQQTAQGTALHQDRARARMLLITLKLTPSS